MSTKTITLRGPEIKIAEHSLSCYICSSPIKPGDTYALFPAFCPGKQSIMVPICTNHGWADDEERRG